MRAGLEGILHASGLIDVVGGSSAQAELAALVARAAPDVVLAEADDFDALPGLLGGISDTPLALIVGDLDPAAEMDAFRAGVCAILPRGATVEAIAAAVYAVAAGLAVLPADLIDDLETTRQEQAAGLRPSEPHERLTPREIEVLALLSDGAGNKTIAYRLGVSEHTVKFHLSSIFTKLGVKNRTEAVRLGMKLGLIML